MPAFLIEVDDTKDGILYPPVIGPFKDEETAEQFADKYGLGTASETQGGYSTYHVISEATCDYTPEKYADAYSWRLEMLK